MAITKAQAMALRHGDILHAPELGSPARPCESPNGPYKWRVSGRCSSWVRDPERFRLPIKWGLYISSAVDQDNAHLFHLEQDCTAPALQVTGDYRNHAMGCDRPYEHPGGCLPYGV